MGVRKSKPREILLEELQKLDTHPRGDELYGLIRQRWPQVSMGTVYRNLAFLRRQGLIAEIFCGDFNRYDGNTSQHPHFLCRRCKQLWDVEGSGLPAKIAVVGLEDSFQVEGHYIVFYGLCNRCLSEQPG
jgi:Fe2+ or Zn2+ uptake regulation protein